MKSKKPTNKEIIAKVEMLNRVNTTVIQMVENLGNTIKQYIEFKEDADEFEVEEISLCLYDEERNEK